MRLTEQRTDGTPMTVHGARVPFCLFPTDYAGQNSVPLQEPWSYAEFYIKNEFPDNKSRYALAYLEQARSFYETARKANRDAAPLLWYYCFLNLTKTLLVRDDAVDNLAGGMHGISDPAENKEGYLSLNKQTISAWGALTSGSGRYQIFPNLCKAVGQPLAAGENKMSVKSLLRQVLGIHRAFMKAFEEDSHFIKLREPQFLEHNATGGKGGELWLRFFLLKEDFNDTVKFDELRKQLDPVFKAVTPGDTGEEMAGHCFESTHRPFTRWSSDELPALQKEVGPKIRTLVLPRGSLHYVMFERENTLPQVAVLYAIMFYLGSIVRYRPYDFDKLVTKKYRWVIDEFLQIAPKQFVILMISQITRSEISYFET
ncbi:MAG: YaaC family protein [Candidatus Methylacidiphilales bacterium]|nr:YaaC family protein [Candidatus Methylacidiphilales bacterium]